MAEESLAASNTPSTKRHGRWLGQKIIKSKFQFKFTGVVFAFLAIACFLIWFEGYWVINRMVASGLIQHEETIIQLKLLTNIVAKTCVLSMAVVFGLALFFSHFIAGPIYRFEKTLEAMRSGDLTISVRLRKYDELKEVADLFNQTLASLREKVKVERDVIEDQLLKISTLAEKLKKEGRLSEAGELEQIVFSVRNSPPQIRI